MQTSAGISHRRQSLCSRGARPQAAVRRAAILRAASGAEGGSALVGKPAEEANEEELDLCREVEFYMERLYARRDMRTRELRLILGIEDPRREREREELGGGRSDPDDIPRDDVVQAFDLVVDGRVPEDRTTLEKLVDELRNWPYLDTEFEEEQKNLAASYEEVTDTGMERPQRFRDERGAPRPPIGREGESDSNPGLLGSLKDTFGYAYLYVISAIPVIIFGAVIALLFYSSLQ